MIACECSANVTSPRCREQYDSNDGEQDKEIEIDDKEDDTGDDRYQRDEEIGDEIFPRDLLRAEFRGISFSEKQRADFPPAESAHLPPIVAVGAVKTNNPKFEREHAGEK